MNYRQSIGIFVNLTFSHIADLSLNMCYEFFSVFWSYQPAHDRQSTLDYWLMIMTHQQLLQLFTEKRTFIWNHYPQLPRYTIKKNVPLKTYIYNLSASPFSKKNLAKFSGEPNGKILCSKFIICGRLHNFSLFFFFLSVSMKSLWTFV